MSPTPNVSNSSPLLSNVNTDSAWVIQGRVIPASCTDGHVMLYLQAKSTEWEEGHYHSGHCPIPAELGVELAVATMVPFHSSLVVKSLDSEERRRGWAYVYMAKVINPPECLACVAVNGKTLVIQIKDMEYLFQTDSECNFCSGEALDFNYSNLPETALDAMMEIKGNNKEH